MRLPPIPPIDAFSFWLGFASAAFIFLLLYWFQRPLRLARQILSELFQHLREALTAGTEKRLREDTLRFAQTAHLAGTVFALNEILLPPRLLYPEPALDPTTPPPDEDLAAIIPIIPEWPDLAGIYHAPTLGVEEVFAKDANIMVIGGPGGGKSTLLAHLATRAAQDDEKLFPGGVTPIFVHAGDLELPRPPKADVAQPLIAAALARVSTLTASQLPQHLRGRLKNYKCAILIDGLDELPPAQIAPIASWLEEFQREYKHHRLIVAAGLWGYGPLVSLGLAPIMIAPWNADDYRELIQKWTTAWDQAIRARRKKAAGPGEVDLTIMRGWLANGNQGRTIFEITLKIWAALAGDTRGSRPVDWLEAYLLRHNLKPTSLAALAQMATAMLSQQEYLGLLRKEAAAIGDTALKGPDGKSEMDSDDFLDGLIARRLLAKHAKDRVSFAHGLTAAYCTAQSLAAEPDTILGASSAWARALYFFAALGDLTSAAGRNLTQAADLMQSELLACALWLRDSPANARWRAEVFKRLARLMLDPNQPENLRLRGLTGLAASNDPAVVALFKQALASPDPFSRRLATLGLGALGDGSLVPQLVALFADPYLDVRWAAALALTHIGTDQAIDGLAQGLVQGDDALKQACAQAIARNAEVGPELLKEAIAHEDLAVRRAALFGLADLKTDWALKQIEDVQTKEQQWIVRNAAVSMIERLKSPSQVTLQPYAPPESQGWLVAWAASKGTGVPPGKGAIDLLNRALTEGEERVRLAAAQSLGRLGEPTAARELYAALRDPAPLIRDAAFRALAHMAALAGQKLAAPV